MDEPAEGACVFGGGEWGGGEGGDGEGGGW